MNMCHTFIVSGLEYKFMVKSVDPDETVSVTEKKIEHDVLHSQNLDLHEDEMQEEEHGDLVGDLSSPAPMILEEDRTLPNRTGNMHYFNLTQEALWTLVQAQGPNTQMLQIW